MAVIPKEVVGDLYAAFSSVPKPTTIPTSLFGIEREESEKLLATPLRDLNEDDLDPYVRQIFHDGGSPADFRYLLPRILELLPHDGGMSWMGLVGRCLGEHPWDAFTSEQKSAVSRFFFAELDEILARKAIGEMELDSLICGASFFLPEWDRMLERIASEPSAIAALLRWNAKAVRDGFHPHDGWSTSPKESHFLEWLRSDETQLRAWSR